MITTIGILFCMLAVFLGGMGIGYIIGSIETPLPFNDIDNTDNWHWSVDQQCYQNKYPTTTGLGDPLHNQKYLSYGFKIPEGYVECPKHNWLYKPEHGCGHCNPGVNHEKEV